MQKKFNNKTFFCFLSRNETERHFLSSLLHRFYKVLHGIPEKGRCFLIFCISFIVLIHLQLPYNSHYVV